MSGKIKSLILVLIIISIVSIAVRASTDDKSEASATTSATTSNRVVTTASSSGGASVSTSGGKVSMTSQSMSKAEVKQGDSYTITLNENPSDNNWKLTHSNGLKILSDNLEPDGTREIKVLAAEKGEQTIEAEYHDSGEGKQISQTMKVTLNVV